MRKSLLLVPFVLLAAAAVVLTLGAKKAPPETPLGVLIVTESLHSAEGVGKPETLSVVNEESIKDLEKMFPNYHTLPSSPDAAGWKAGWRVYFNFPKGRTVRVTVSGNDDGQTWSTGDGDFATKGDFAKLLEQLQTQTPK